MPVKTVLKRCQSFVKGEVVLCVSLVLAVLTAFAVPPDWAYFSYPDYRTLALLFCLMLIVAGFRSLGVFQRLGGWLLRRAGGFRGLSFALTLLCFFSSMVITNDVTLITFVPFTLLVTRGVSQKGSVLSLVVFETIAANLGSMATPIGNPQNLYLYSVADMGFAQFAWAVLPYTGISLVLLAAALLFQKEEPVREFASQAPGEKLSLPPLLAMLFCLALCLLVVFRVVGYLPVLVCVALVTLLVDRRLYGAVDYALLLTFLCFFIFVGNIKRLPEVNSLLQSLVGGAGAVGRHPCKPSHQQCACCHSPFRLHRQLWRFAYSREPRRLGDSHRLAGQPDFLQILRPGVSRPNGALLQDLHGVEPSLSGSAHRRCSPPYLTKRGALFPFFA